MTTKKGAPETGAETSEPTGITEIAAHYLNSIGGADGGFWQFMQYTQNAGQTGGPASGGGAFWQQVWRYVRRFDDPPA
jgi:hypothetical protein